MSTQQLPSVMRLPDAITLAHAAMTAAAESPVWALTGTEAVTGLEQLRQLAAMVAAAELALVAHAARVGVAEQKAAPDTKTWWANATKQTKRDAARRSHLAASLDRDREQVRDAMAHGEVSEDQAAVIVRAVDALPVALVDPEVVTAAERELIRLAGDHDPKELRTLGRHILDLVAPQVAEEKLARELEADERAAAAKTRLVWHDDGHGQCHGRFTLPSATGAMLAKALNALAAPKHLAADPGDPGTTQADTRPETQPDTRPDTRAVTRPEKLGAALVEFIERYPTDRLPHAGGLAARVVVTMGLDTLLGTRSNACLAAARLDTGEDLSPGQARRMACEAGIIPVVLGGKSEPLDVGRARRFHTPAQRIALTVRDAGCTAEGCDWPPGMCQAHHELPWSRGGSTTVDDGRLLCPRHHTMAHDTRYTMRATKHGRVTFSRRD